jgi:integral membrane protein
MTDRAPSGGSRPLALARAVSLAEAVSFLLLLVATVVKYSADQEIGVRILGPVHGTLFIVYCVLIMYVAAVHHWRPTRTALALIASVLPVAPIFVERHWLISASSRSDAGRPSETAPPPAPDSRPADGAASGQPPARPEAASQAT